MPRLISVVGCAPFFTRALLSTPFTAPRLLLKRPVMRSASLRSGGGGITRFPTTRMLSAAKPGSSISGATRPDISTRSPTESEDAPSTVARLCPGRSPAT